MDNNEQQDSHFGWVDYVMFIMMLGVSSLIGVYFSYWGKKEDSPKEYLHGGKTMGTLSVAVSLVVSSVSGTTMVGDPAEIYSYGTLYTLHCISAVIVGLINNWFYLPVFFELQLTSTYEYLELRFNRSARVMASLLNTVYTTLYLPILIYVPALTLEQVTGLSVHVTSPVIAVFCVFYTVLGGIKAVVWTDFLQGTVMLMSGFVVITLGLIRVGGFSTVWQRNNEGGRIRVFEMNPSPYERMTFWTSTIGSTFGWMEIGVSQWTVQRFLTVPTYSKAQRLLAQYLLGLIIIKLSTCFTGLTLFAIYYACDPIKTQEVKKADQLLTYFVSKNSSTIPGLYGLYVAGIFSASLSTLSTLLNSLGATVYEDFVKPLIKRDISEKRASYIIRTIVVVVGISCVSLIFVMEKLGSVIQMAITASGISGGAMLGLFTFGMLYPRGNTKGVLAGSIFSMLFMGWLVVGAQKLYVEGKIAFPTLPTNTSGCSVNITTTDPPIIESSNEDIFFLYRISFMYYTMIGFFALFFVGIIVSLLTEPQEINPSLISPPIRKYFLRKKSNDIQMNTAATCSIEENKEHS